MNSNNDVLAALNDTAIEMWASVMGFVPMLLVALLVIIIGWIFANGIKRLTIRLFRTLKINEALANAGVDDVLEKGGLQLKAGVFMGTLVKWFVLAIFFVVALDILGLDQATEFVQEVIVGFIPKVIVALFILLVAAIIAGALSKSVVAAVQAATSNEKKARVLGKVAYVAVITIAVLAALNQIGIAPELVQMLFAGIVFTTSLALGLAFGLGGRETASRYLEKLTRDSGMN